MYKKIISIFLCALLTACSGKGSEVKKPEESIQPTETTEAVKVDFSYPITGDDTWSGISYRHDENGKYFSLSAGEESGFVKEQVYFGEQRNYHIRFSLESEKAFSGQMVIADEEKTYLEKEISSQQRDYSFDFQSTTETWSGKISFLLRSEEDTPFKLLDFQMSDRDGGRISIRVNQLGYLKEGEKFLSLALDGGDVFSLVKKDSGETVYRGIIGNGRSDEKNGEYNFLGSFTSFREEGEYYLLTETGLESYPFVISENPYKDVYVGAFRFFTLQRSGIKLSEEIAGDLAHDASHMQSAIPYGYGGITRDVFGGWYDAGDYGRYLQTGIKALVPMLISYDMHRDASDRYNIPESGNGLPDILDEAKWQLDWLLAMRRDDGLVYNKLTTRQFAGNIMPDEDKEDLYLLPAWSLTTTAFAGTMAYAALLYRDTHPTFAAEMEEVARKLGTVVLAEQVQNNFKNPAEFHTGQYDDDSDVDERFFAGAALYALTGEESYLALTETLYSGGNVRGTASANLSDYGEYLLLRYGPKDSALYRKVKENVLAHGDHIEENVKKTNYPYPLGEYSWGSNQQVAEVIFQLALASYVSQQPHYLQAGQHLLNYLLGQNQINMSFVSGFGSRYPLQPHSRMAHIRQTILPGALVGGVNQFLSEDGGAFFNEDTPVGKRYIDRYESYNTNEVAIAYNGAFLLGLSFYVK